MKLFLLLFSVLVLSFPVALLSQENFKVVLIAISVRDLDSTTAWYHKYLGFNLTDKKDFPDNNVSIALLEKNGVQIELVRHRQSVAASKLVQNLDNPALIQGYGKVAYEVADIERIVRIMKVDGVRFLYDLRDSAGKAFAGYRSCIVLDNDGNWVQLYQKK